ncbi:hypothetical protein ABH905_003763 [Pseudomonas frederiksbergensis]
MSTTWLALGIRYEKPEVLLSRMPTTREPSFGPHR